MKKINKYLLIGIVAIILFIVGGIFVYVSSIISTSFDSEKNVYIYIDERKNYNDIISQIDTAAKVQDLANFKRLSAYMKYPENIKIGCYMITPDMNIRTAIQVLRSGKQTPVKLRFNNIRLKEDLAKRISDQLMMSDADLLTLLNDSSVCAKYGFSTETIICMFIPNTYEIYWDIRPEALLQRMKNEYDKFWTADRKKKAAIQGLTPIEVSGLASIVEEECYFSDEYPVVAGLYLNRLKRGQMLQADPTVKYAVGDFSLKRILNKHIKTISPYNTYTKAGLPPGPIRVPSIKAIDAVLNPAQHDYLYMCAKEDFSGRHNFATTHAEHTRNANKYHAALNQRNIY